MDEISATQTTEQINVTQVTGDAGSGSPDQFSEPSQESWDKVIRWIIYALTAAIPLAFVPWTLETLEFTKQMILFVLTAAGLTAWLLKLLVLRRWKFVKTVLDVPIGIFLLVYLLASIFSVDRIASFLGFYGSFSGNFFQVVFLVLFYYLVVNNFQTQQELRRLLGVFFFSSMLALLYAVLQFFGLFLLPVAITKATNFNTVGSLLTLSLFAGLMIPLSLAFQDRSWFRFPGGRLWRILGVLAAFLILLTVNFLFAWVAFLAGILVFMIFQVSMAADFSVRKFVTPLVMLVVGISFLIIQLVFPTVTFRSIVNFQLPLEVRLDYATAKPVLVGVLRESPILGTGPNTFLYAFSKHRDESFNLSPFWNVRFDKASSEAAEYLVGTGILGLLAFEILSLIFIIYGLLFLLRQNSGGGWGVLLAAFAGVVLLWIAHWFFFFNTVMVFSFWLLIALFMAMTRIMVGDHAPAVEFTLGKSPRQTVGVVSAVSLGLVLVIVFLFFAFSIYAADIFFRKGIVVANEPDRTEIQSDEAQGNFERAIQLNRFRPDYYLTYSEFLLSRINQELVKSDPNLGLIQSWLATSINTSRAAVNFSPNNWTAWERLANLYGFARPLVAGVDQFIIDSLTRATESDPKNPILFAELGQVYRLAARSIDPSILGNGVDTDLDGLSDEQEGVLGSNPEDPDTNGNQVLDGNEVLAGLNPVGSGQLPQQFLNNYLKINQEALLKAEESFRKAIALKSDYATAYYQLGLTLEQSGQADQAIEELEGALTRFPTNVSIKFDLGRIYFNSGKVDAAARQFQDIVNLVPSHANARFSLALSFERLGKTQRALDEYRRLLESNPDNQAIQQKIVELEAAIAAQAAAAAEQAAQEQPANP